MRRWYGLAVLAASIGVPIGCQPNGRVSPPSLRLGQEACARCRMIISDARFAAALTTEAGDTAKFDDVGCMVEHEAGAFRATTVYWVRDFKSDAWLDAREAIFVRSKEINSPMGFGLAAMRTPPAPGEFGGTAQPTTSRLSGLSELIAPGHGGRADSKS